MLMRQLLRMLRGKTASARHGARSTAHLVVEALEERQALSTTSFDYQLWRNSVFSLDQGAEQDPSIQLLQTNDVHSSAMEGTSLIGLDRVFSDYSYRGTGYTVAVIDTGIDYNHASLGGGMGRRVVAGWDFVNDDGDPMDDNGHGTHVAGIIGSSHANYTGIAPNINLIALKVLDANGSGNFGDVEDALEWVVANQSRYNIVAINMSLGAGNYTSNPYTFLEDDFQTLKSQGVFIAAAAGNSFYTYNSAPGLGYAAISPLAVGVGAVWAGNVGSVSWMSGARDYTTAADRITSFSQRSADIDLFAPGALLTNTYLGGGFRSMAGTSMATPVVAGAAAIIHQALDAAGLSGNANQDFILSLMKSTGANIVDGDDENDNVTNTGLTFKRLNLHAALSSISTSNAAPVLNAVADRTMRAAEDTTVITLSASDANGDPLTFTARTSDSRVIAVVRGNQVTLDPQPGFLGTAQVDVTVSDGRASASRSFRLTVTNVAPTLTPIADRSMRTTDDRITVPLSATDADGDTLTYSARVLPSKAALAYQLKQELGWTNYGNTFTNFRGYNEKYVLGNAGWYVVMQNGEVYRWAGNMTASLTDQNYVATFDSSYWTDPSRLWDAQPDKAALAHQLNQELGWTYYGGYFTNHRGYNEKYILGNAGWYVVMQNGEVYRWANTMGETLRPANLVATFDSSYWADPSRLWDAQPVVPVTLSIAGNQLTIDPAAGYKGAFDVEVTVTDGTAPVSRVFRVAVNAPPVLNSIGNVTMSPGQDTATIDLSATDGDGDSLTYTARVMPTGAALAYQLDQQLGWSYAGSYYTNYRGYNEKYIFGNDGWYVVMQNGEVYHWAGSMSATLQTENLVAAFDSSYWTDPSLLWNAPAASAPAITFRVNGNQLTIDPASGYRGSFQVEVTVSDGVSTHSRRFWVNVG